MTENKRDAIGMKYSPISGYCSLLFYDAANAFICPSGFIAVDGIGTGPIRETSGGTSGEECYACHKE